MVCSYETYHWVGGDRRPGCGQMRMASVSGWETLHLFLRQLYGAMDAFIKGSSGNADIRELLLCFEKLECNGSHWPWFSRVPSASNCADDPTRVGNVLGKFLQGAVRDRCFCPITGVEIADFLGPT